MLGAILGDMIGSPYEFATIKQPKNFIMWEHDEHFTDDSILTTAVTEALLNIPLDADRQIVKWAVTTQLKRWFKKYPHVPYGNTFTQWAWSEDSKPYNSWGNGAAMRISTVGWLYNTLERTLEVAKWVTEVTHNNAEAIKGAQCVAEAIFLLRTNPEMTKDQLRSRLMDDFGYDLTLTCEEIRPTYTFDVSCQGTVPQAIIAFLDGHSFEDVIRNAVYLGGDSDTIACIAGSIAETIYKIPNDFKKQALPRLPVDIKRVYYIAKRLLKCE